MSYNIEVTAYFARQLKRLVKKYPSLRKDFAELIIKLKENPEQGTNLGNNCYKIRLAIVSKKQRKIRWCESDNSCAYRSN
jgi:mRNA-degrading endonuclease RelE of RelBE toxin-antitoxin system